MNLRRSNGKYVYVLFGFVMLFLVSFNWWGSRSQNSDLQTENEKLQAEIKISALNQEQTNRKNSLLQNSIQTLEEEVARLKLKVEDDNTLIKTSDKDLKLRSYEVTKLKSDLSEQIAVCKSVEKKLFEKEEDIERLRKENDLIISQKEDAIDAVKRKDSQIEVLKQRVDDLHNELENCKRECVDRPDSVIKQNYAKFPASKKGVLVKPGQLLSVSTKSVHIQDKGLSGMRFHGVPILPREPHPLKQIPMQHHFDVLEISHEENPVGEKPKPEQLNSQAEEEQESKQVAAPLIKDKSPKDAFETQIDNGSKME